MTTDPHTSPHRVDLRQRDDKGRFLALFCDDRDCCGVLMIDSEFGHDVWRCDGLTFDTISGPLRECGRTYPALKAKAGGSPHGR